MQLGPLHPVTMERGSGFSYMKYGTAVSLLVILLSYWFRPPLIVGLDERLDAVLSSLLRAERKAAVNNARPRVAIGKNIAIKLV